MTNYYITACISLFHSFSLLCWFNPLLSFFPSGHHNIIPDRSSYLLVASVLNIHKMYRNISCCLPLQVNYTVNPLTQDTLIYRRDLYKYRIICTEIFIPHALRRIFCFKSVWILRPLRDSNVYNFVLVCIKIVLNNNKNIVISIDCWLQKGCECLVQT